MQPNRARNRRKALKYGQYGKGGVNSSPVPG
nr:MAG TPA: hypothetical protein [Caudoviricetes sp.]